MDGNKTQPLMNGKAQLFNYLINKWYLKDDNKTLSLTKPKIKRNNMMMKQLVAFSQRLICLNKNIH